MTKVREIRALKDVDRIKIDRVPTILDEKDVAAIDPSQIRQDFFSMPGVALKRGEYYLVVLDEDQIFKAKADHTYLINFKLRQRLDKLHPNSKEDAIQIEKPLGREKFVVEVHFPPTRRLGKVNGKVKLTVYEVRDSELKEIDSTKYIINADAAIEAIPGKPTDMFRLTLPHPPQDADIRIKWQWSVIPTFPG